jgi:hypothetical protein
MYKKTNKRHTKIKRDKERKRTKKMYTPFLASFFFVAFPSTCASWIDDSQNDESVQKCFVVVFVFCMAPRFPVCKGIFLGRVGPTTPSRPIRHFYPTRQWIAA